MLWGALWDQVRDAQIAPERFAELALAELPRETGRADRSSAARSSRARASRVRRAGEGRIGDRRRGAHAVGTARATRRSPTAFARHSSMPSSGSPRAADGVATTPDHCSAPTPPPANRCATPHAGPWWTGSWCSDAPDAERALAAQAARDTTPDGRRRTFIAGAGRPLGGREGGVLPALLRRLHAERGLGERKPRASSTRSSSRISRSRILRPALDSLPFIQANRRIFFLGSWLGAFIGGHTSDAALRVVEDLSRRSSEDAQGPA